MVKSLKLLKSKTNLPQLIPSYKKPERRLLSVLMGTLNILPGFRNEVLKQFGYNSGRTCDYQSYMEPQYEHPGLSKVRPDGLMICSRGATTWTAFIEAKANNQNIGSDQMQDYAELASKLGVDAVISISNAFSNSPTELPYHLPSSKRRQREIFHVAWPQLRSLLSNMVENGKFSSEVEAKIAKETLRYFGDNESGVQTFDQMSQSWPRLVDAAGIEINIKSLSGFSEVISDWQQERRDLLDKLSSWTVGGVRIQHEAGSRASTVERTKHDKLTLSTSNELRAEFRLEKHKQFISITPNLKSKSLRGEFRFNSPKGKKARAAMSWAAKSLESLQGKDYFIKIDWPGYGRDNTIKLDEFLAYPDAAHECQSSAPKQLELIYVVNNVRKFRSRKGFIEIVEALAEKLLNDARECELQ